MRFRCRVLSIRCWDRAQPDLTPGSFLRWEVGFCRAVLKDLGFALSSDLAEPVACEGNAHQMPLEGAARKFEHLRFRCGTDSGRAAFLSQERDLPEAEPGPEPPDQALLAIFPLHRDLALGHNVEVGRGLA